MIISNYKYTYIEAWDDAERTNLAFFILKDAYKRFKNDLRMKNYSKLDIGNCIEKRKEEELDPCTTRKISMQKEKNMRSMQKEPRVKRAYVDPNKKLEVIDRKVKELEQVRLDLIKRKREYLTICSQNFFEASHSSENLEPSKKRYNLRKRKNTTRNQKDRKELEKLDKKLQDFDRKIMKMEKFRISLLPKLTFTSRDVSQNSSETSRNVSQTFKYSHKLKGKLLVRQIA